MMRDLTARPGMGVSEASLFGSRAFDWLKWIYAVTTYFSFFIGSIFSTGPECVQQQLEW
jgi:hypothetical protein